MYPIYQRVAKWNAQRYDRVYNKGLAIKLLREEYQEYLEAKTQVERLDALCDMAYVAYGAIWKLDITLTQMEYAGKQSEAIMTNNVNSNELWPVFFIGTFLDVQQYTEGYPPEQTMFNIITACICQMVSMGFNLEEVETAMTIVCDSNDSKSLPKAKVASNVKANVYKGDGFIPPEPRLQALLDGVKESLA